MVYDLFLALEANIKKKKKEKELNMFLLIAASALDTAEWVSHLVPCCFQKPLSLWQLHCQGSMISTCKILHLDTTNQPEFIIYLKWDLDLEYRGAVASWGRGHLQDWEVVHGCPVSAGSLTLLVVLTAWTIQGGLHPFPLKVYFDLKGRNCLMWKVGAI